MVNEYHITALLVMFIGGAAGGWFAGIFTKTDLPRKPDEDQGMQSWARRNPVWALIIFGAVGGALVPFILTVLSGVLGDNSVLERVLAPDSCGEVGELLAAYRNSYDVRANAFNENAFIAEIQNMGIKGGVGESVCDSWLMDVAILFGLSLIVGYSIRGLIPGLSASVLAKLESVEDKAGAAASNAANAQVAAEVAKVAATEAAAESRIASDKSATVESRTRSVGAALEMVPQAERNAFEAQLEALVTRAVRDAKD